MIWIFICMFLFFYRFLEGNYFVEGFRVFFGGFEADLMTFDLKKFGNGQERENFDFTCPPVRKSFRTSVKKFLDVCLLF